VRVGENIVAWLETGHILIDQPTRSKFNRLAKTLLRWGTHIDLKQVEEAYFNTRVIAPSQYEAAVRLLQIFAGHLAQLGGQIALRDEENEPLPVSKARQWVVTHCEDSLSLAAAAQAVNLSAKYFSDVFRKATGIPFVEYVGRVRVEKAKNLLAHPQLRISEIAYQVGFQSLSQFNRAFRRHAGTSPRDYRHALPGPANRQKTGKMRSLSGEVRRTASDPLASYQSSNGDIPHLNKQQLANL
jgi:AraC-like DNA-binding protein